MTTADATRLGLPGGAPSLLDFGGRTVTLPGCAAARATVRAGRTATTVRARGAMRRALRRAADGEDRA